MDKMDEFDEFDEVLELDGRDFLVIKKVVLNNKTYIYVFAMDESKDYSVLLETESDGIKYVESVEDENIIKEVLMKVVEEGIDGIE